MAMDTIHRLVQAVLIDGQMTRPSGHNSSNIPTGPWVSARVLEAAVVGDHETGAFNGYVRFVIAGQDRAMSRTFHDLWLEDWTTFEYREQIESVRAKPKRRSSAKKPKRRSSAKKRKGTRAQNATQTRVRGWSLARRSTPAKSRMDNGSSDTAYLDAGLRWAIGCLHPYLVPRVPPKPVPSRFRFYPPVVGAGYPARIAHSSWRGASSDPPGAPPQSRPVWS